MAILSLFEACCHFLFSISSISFSLQNSFLYFQFCRFYFFFTFLSFKFSYLQVPTLNFSSSELPHLYFSSHNSIFPFPILPIPCYSRHSSIIQYFSSHALHFKKNLRDFVIYDNDRWTLVNSYIGFRNISLAPSAHDYI
jgi:hypothetical protein